MIPRSRSSFVMTLVACLSFFTHVASTAAEQTSRPAATIRPGETVQGIMAAGDPTAYAPWTRDPVIFMLRTELAGRLTVEARSFDFDTHLSVSRVTSENEVTPVAEDQDGGAGTNSRLVFEAVADAFYQVEVRRTSTILVDVWRFDLNAACPSTFDLEMSWGEAQIDPDTARQADQEYWVALEARAAEEKRPECRVEALHRRSVSLLTQQQFTKARTMGQEALTIAEQHGDPLVLAAALALQAQVTYQCGLRQEFPLADEVNRALIRDYLDRAMAIREERLGPDHILLGWLLEGQASLLGVETEITRQSPSPAIKKYLDRAIAIFDKWLGPDALEVAACLWSLAQYEHNVGNTRRGIAHQQRCYDICLQAAPHPDAIGGLRACGTNLAFGLVGLGKWSEARAVREHLVGLSAEHYGPVQTAWALINLGAFYMQMGLFPEAQEAYARAINTLETSEDDTVFAVYQPAALALSRAAQGNLLLEMGDHDEALTLLENALEFFESPPQTPQTKNRALQMRIILAMHHAMFGNADTARSLIAEPMRETLELQEDEERLQAMNKGSGGLGPIRARLFSFGTILMELGSYTEARDLMLKGIELFELGSLDELLENAGSLENWAPMHPLHTLGRIYRALDDYERARACMEAALTLAERFYAPEHPVFVNLLTDLSRLDMETGQTGAGLDKLLLAEEITRRHHMLVSRTLIERHALAVVGERTTLNLALRLAHTDIGTTDQARILDALIRSRALVLDQVASRWRVIMDNPEAAQDYLEANDRLANLTVRGPGDGAHERYSEALDEARRERDTAEQALARVSDAFRSEQERSRIGLENVRDALPTGNGLVAYARYDRPPEPDRPGSATSSDGAYVAFVIGGKDIGKVKVVSLGPATEIDAVVARWREEAGQGSRAGERTGIAAESTYREAGQALRERVWDPIATLLGPVRDVFIVPDGTLNFVAFGALPTDRNRYMVEEERTFHYLSAERDLLRVDAASPRNQGLLVLSAPSFDSESSPTAHARAAMPVVSSAATQVADDRQLRGTRSACRDFHDLQFNPLFATAQEADEIESIWSRAHTSAVGKDAIHLKGNQASEEAFKVHAPDHRVVHIATHGFFMGGRCPSTLDGSRGIGGLAEVQEGHRPPGPGENSLLLSGLALAGANHRSAAGPGEDDGILTAEEIAAMDLSGVEWAVLSACDTGVGEVRAGEGVFGLRRAFQIAGVDTLIMSLWSVDDEATREWMRELYEGRLLKGLSTAAAVREASLSVLNARRQRGDSTHPFYWAAFVAAGDWR